MRASEAAEADFNQCMVPDENRLGELGEGFIHSMKILDGGQNFNLLLFLLGLQGVLMKRLLSIQKNVFSLVNLLTAFKAFLSNLLKWQHKSRQLNLLTQNAGELD